MPRVNTGELHSFAEEIANSHLAITSETLNPPLITDGHPNNYNIDAASDHIYYSRPVYGYNSSVYAVTQFVTHCKCCGLTMCSSDYIETDICDRCKELIAKEMFEPKNQNFTCNNVINIVRGKINAV